MNVGGCKGVIGMSRERANEYRRKAEEYRLKASKAALDYDKAAWLKLAEDWQRFAESVPRQRAPDDLPQSKSSVSRMNGAQ